MFGIHVLIGDGKSDNDRTVLVTVPWSKNKDISETVRKENIEIRQKNETVTVRNSFDINLRKLPLSTREKNDPKSSFP